MNLEKWREQELKDRAIDNFLTQGSCNGHITHMLAFHKILQPNVLYPDLEAQPASNIHDFLQGQCFFQRKQLAQFKFHFVCHGFHTNSGI